MDRRIDTPRLVLRPPRAEDFDGWAAFMADEEASRWIGGPLSRAMAWRGFLTVVGAWEIQGFGMFSVVERATGEWVGRLGPWMPEGWPGPEVGWGIVRSRWRRGYATEGSIAAIGWAFAHLRWDEVIHCIDPANAASIRVAERLGSRRRGTGRLPEPFGVTPVEIWGQTRREWLSSGVLGDDGGTVTDPKHDHAGAHSHEHSHGDVTHAHPHDEHDHEHTEHEHEHSHDDVIHSHGHTHQAGVEEDHAHDH